MMAAPIIRLLKQDDHNYVYSTWSQALYTACSCHQVQPRMKFLEHFANPFTKNMMYESSGLVACLQDSPNVILGYIIYSPPKTVHWIHVKPEFQGMKIARALWLASNLPVSAAIATSWHKSVSGAFRRFFIEYRPGYCYTVGKEE